MMPMETTLSIPAEESSLENLTNSNEDQTRVCLLPSNFDRHASLKQHHRRYPHISAALNQESITPLRSQWDINNNMLPMGCYYDDKNYPIIPFSLALNPSLVSVERDINSSQTIDCENRLQSYPIPNQQYRYGQPYPLPVPSLVPTPVDSSARAKRKHVKRVHQLSPGQPLPSYPTHFVRPIISNYWPSLPSMTNVATRPNERIYPAGLLRTSNSPSTAIQHHLLPHQTVGQCSLDHRCNHAQKSFNLSNNLPYHFNYPYERYYIPRSNTMSMNIPTTLLPRFDTTFSSRYLSNNNIKHLSQEHKSETIENPLVEVNKVSKVTQRRQKKSKPVDHRIRKLMKRMKQKNKSAILKFMSQKRKEKLQMKTEQAVSKPSQTQLIASNLKITFNATQTIESISLYYHQHKPNDSLIASNTTENRLDLLIEAANFVEMNKNNSKVD